MIKYRASVSAIFASVAFLLTACSHAPGGFLSRRGENTYDVFVGGAVSKKEDSFYAGAHFTCLHNHGTGFEVKDRLSDSYGSMEGTIVCEGAPDSYLNQKFSGLDLEVEPSSIKYEDGVRFKVVPETDELL